MSSAQQTEAVSPATGQVIGHSPLNTVDELEDIIAGARQAQSYWAGLDPRIRAGYLKSVRDYIVANADELAETISRDNGKTRIDALSTEVLPAAMAISYYMKMAPRFLKPKNVMPGNILLANKLARIHRVPFGVIGIISPWNYPFGIPFSEVVMGLLAGNAVILKTASETQMVGRRLEEAFVAAGLPHGVFSYVNLPGRVAGEAFLRGGVDKLFFTGSVPVGKKLMALAAESLTPVSLELGGNDAMLVCPDADLERASAGAVWAGLSNCGQSCGGVERVYVHRAVYGHFMELLKKRVEALRIGQDLNHDVELGAMTTERQMEVVRRHLDDALSKGAEVFAQALPPEGAAGNFMPATVLSEVTHDMDVMCEETFGPILGIMKVANMEEAVALANDSQLGLTGSVWSKSHGEARRLARRIKAGAITINDHLMSHGLAETPWGGFKESGIGRTHGKLGFDEMTEPQAIVDDIMPGLRKNMWWHPHGPGVYAGLKGIIDFLYGKGLEARFLGAKNLLKLFPRSFKP